jgi:hypothetical protein
VPLLWLTFPEHGGHHPLLLVAVAVSVTALFVELARPLPEAVAT